MFSVAERTAIRAELIALAERDSRIVGAALAGSAARGTEDAWSDIDLLLQLHPAADEPAVVDDWTDAIDTRRPRDRHGRRRRECDEWARCISDEKRRRGR